MQSSITIQNGSGLEVRAAINNALQSIVTDFAGATDPATTTPSNAFPFCTWLDTANNLLKRRNAANTVWNNVGTLSDDKIMLFNVYGHSGVRNITTDTTLADDDSNKLIVVNSASAVTLTMPTATTYMSFKVYNKGTGTVTLTNGTFYGETGSSVSVALSQYQSIELHSDGTAFYAI